MIVAIDFGFTFERAWLADALRSSIVGERVTAIACKLSVMELVPPENWAAFISQHIDAK